MDDPIVTINGRHCITVKQATEQHQYVAGHLRYLIRTREVACWVIGNTAFVDVEDLAYKLKPRPPRRDRPKYEQVANWIRQHDPALAQSAYETWQSLKRAGVIVSLGYVSRIVHDLRRAQSID